MDKSNVTSVSLRAWSTTSTSLKNNKWIQATLMLKLVVAPFILKNLRRLFGKITLEGSRFASRIR